MASCSQIDFQIVYCILSIVLCCCWLFDVSLMAGSTTSVPMCADTRQQQQKNSAPRLRLTTQQLPSYYTEALVYYTTKAVEYYTEAPKYYTATYDDPAC